MTQSMRALAMRNADLSTSVMINSCGSDACNSTLGRMSASGQFLPFSFHPCHVRLSSETHLESRRGLNSHSGLKSRGMHPARCSAGLVSEHRIEQIPANLIEEQKIAAGAP